MLLEVFLKCANCGCQLTATKKKGRLTYYYCTNGKGLCSEHKAYLKEEYLSKELSFVFEPLLFDEKIIELVYRAKLQEQKQGFSYLEESIAGLRSRLKKLDERKNTLLDAYLDKVLAQDDFEPKNEALNNEMLELKKNIEELESQKIAKDNITLERIKKLFLSPKNMKKLFLEANSEKTKRNLKFSTLER